jgi:hypothetical protein
VRYDSLSVTVQYANLDEPLELQSR